jgi:hypothetical protein
MASMTPNVGPSPAPPTAAGAEQRGAPRHPAASVPAITGLRMAPLGFEATLVNISVTGLLAECPEAVRPGLALTVIFEGTFVPRSMSARVLRSAVASMHADGRLRYHVGIAFSRPIALDAGDAELTGSGTRCADPAKRTARAASPRREHAPAKSSARLQRGRCRAGSAWGIGVPPIVVGA